MGTYRKIVAIGLWCVLAGCASAKKHTIDGLQPLANHSEWQTTLDPGTAVDGVAKAVVPFGFEGEKSFWGGSGAPKPTGDYFDQGFAVANQHGQEIHVRVLWIREGKTQIILETALPRDRHDFVVKKVKESLGAVEGAGGK